MEVLIDEGALRARVADLGRAIRRDAGAGVSVHMIAALKGAFVFLADLMRAIDGPVTCDFVGVSSYGSATVPGEVRVRAGFDGPLGGRHVVIVEDIVDTGRTLARLQTLVRDARPASMKTVCLLDKPSRRLVEVAVDYVGFTIEDRFVVGYGLDLNEQYRNLPYVGWLESVR